ncbi:MAG: diaminopimelate decarboxylase family protein, partial [bacterium]
CELIGLHAHLGSQISEIAPYAVLGRKMRSLANNVRSHGHALQYLDIGGGLGVDYMQPITMKPGSRGTGNLAIDPKEVAAVLLESLADLDLQLIFEPGRALVASAGLLLTKVLYLKETAGKRFIIVDAGISELLRPSLYKAYHAIVPAVLQNSDTVLADVVGPICESGDFFARDRELPAVERGDMLAVLTAGAYGFSLSSNYNARPRPAEILISGQGCKIIREREKIENIWQ